MRLLGEVLSLAVDYLTGRGISQPKIVAGMLLAQVLQRPRIELYMHFDLPLQEQELSLFRSFIKRAGVSEPMEYILGQVEFYGCTIALSSSVLIPRVETEILVDKAVERMVQEEGEENALWDLCTGSGCIGLSLKKKFPSLCVTLADVSAEALAVCRKNATINDLKVDILQGDLLAPFEGKKAKYIFCNPPYVADGEYENLQVSVKNYEPKLALVGGATGLEFYRRLSQELPLYLEPGAKVFLETGTGQGGALEKLFSAPYWKKKEVILDFAGHERFFFLEIE